MQGGVEEITIDSSAEGFRDEGYLASRCRPAHFSLLRFGVLGVQGSVKPPIGPCWSFRALDPNSSEA